VCVCVCVCVCVANHKAVNKLDPHIQIPAVTDA